MVKQDFRPAPKRLKTLAEKNKNNKKKQTAMTAP